MLIFMPVLLISLLAATLNAAPAHAAFKSGNDLFFWCSASRPDPDFDTKWGECLGYIIGAADSGERGNRRICLPGEATIGEVRDTVIQYLVMNPQMRHYPADLLVTLALSQAFPCR
jgi:hypothetical protein